jgi:hypothetical protein
VAAQRLQLSSRKLSGQEGSEMGSQHVGFVSSPPPVMSRITLLSSAGSGSRKGFGNEFSAAPPSLVVATK